MGVSLILQGDFNQYEQDERTFSLATGRYRQAKVTQAHSPELWGHILARCTLLDHQCFNHFNAANNALNSLTKVFLAGPAYNCNYVGFEADVWDPLSISLRGISDHAPNKVVLKPKGREDKGKGFRPIHPATCKLPAFKRAVKLLIEAANLDSLPPWER